MSSARFARSGRLRICILMSMLSVLIMMIVIYQMSQNQLDESRAGFVRCEKNQEGLNEQLQSLNDQRTAAEKELHNVRNEKASLQKIYDAQVEKYESQLNKYKLLEVKHSELEANFVKSKKQHLEDTSAFEKKLSSMLADVHKDKTTKEREVTAWKQKFDNLALESEQKIHNLESTILDYKNHCNFTPKVLQSMESEASPQLNKQSAHTSATTRTSAQMIHNIEKPRNEKSFEGQLQIVPKTLKTAGSDGDDVQDAQLKSQPQQQQEDPVLAAGVAAVAPASPLSAPRKVSSTAASKDGIGAEAPPNASVAPKLSSSGLPPLAVPPPKPASARKLPENVAPIPENFDDDKADNKVVDAIDVDNAAEELPKNENSKNNRYANVVNELEHNKGLGVAPKPNEDSGAHEVKDFLNEQNFNLPAGGEAENNFFDGAAAAVPADEVGNKPLIGQNDIGGGGGGGGDDDDDLMGNVADVAVKQPQNLLDGENLNNEIAGDQGKEFPEGLHLDDGLEEDQDEDDYSNMNARKQGAEAIRH